MVAKDGEVGGRVKNCQDHDNKGNCLKCQQYYQLISGTRCVPTNCFSLNQVTLECNQCNDSKLSRISYLLLLLFSPSNFEKILVKNVSWGDYNPVFIICSFRLSQA